MENMAEEELLPQEKEEAQVRVPTPDSAPVPAPAADTALDSAPTPDSAPAPALAPAPAPALSPSLASVPEEAESKRHISIQRRLADLEKLAFGTEGDVDSASSLNSDNLENIQTCPLCPKEKFRAYSSHKLRRHLQNLHWKISVEFEGSRMCICHLACRPVKPTIVGEQISSKLGAHYHCIICSATITRRTDMLGHVKRHVNKGETKSRYISASTAKSSNEVLKETDTDIQVFPNYSIPQKTDSYFNPKMKLNRSYSVRWLLWLRNENRWSV